MRRLARPLPPRMAPRARVKRPLALLGGCPVSEPQACLSRPPMRSSVPSAWSRSADFMSVLLSKQVVGQEAAGEADRHGRQEAAHPARTLAGRALGDRVLDDALHGTRRTRPPTPLNNPANSAPTPARSRPTSPNSDRSIVPPSDRLPVDVQQRYPGGTNHYPGRAHRQLWLPAL